MDYYLDKDTAFNRLLEEYKQYNSLVIAYDFDDTVYDFHKKGRTYEKVPQLLRELKEKGCFLICWTGQEDLFFVEKYLKENNIPFNTINENPPFHKSISKKVYANAYLDDRAGLQQVYEQLNNLLKHI